jgi:hypothetical protein
LFFLLQAVGIVLQRALIGALQQRWPASLAKTPQLLRRVANLLFVVAWLLLTAKPLMDDFAVTGLWLLEPVPMSPLRWLGYGHPADSWWRWDRPHWPHWHVGRRWWETGMGL